MSLFDENGESAGGGRRGSAGRWRPHKMAARRVTRRVWRSSGGGRAPPPRVLRPPPGPAPPPGARRAAESGLGAAFVSHRAGRGRRAGAPCRVSSPCGAVAPRTGAAVAARATCCPGRASPCRCSAASASAGTALPRRDRVGSRPRGRERRSGQARLRERGRARPPQAARAGSSCAGCCGSVSAKSALLSQGRCREQSAVFTR